MTSFLGDYTLKIDAKGRVMFPAVFRKQMDAGEALPFVLRKDVNEPCIVLYPAQEWARLMKTLTDGLNSYDKEQNQLRRLMHKDVHQVEPDSLGRILLPSRLISVAEIDKDVVLSGQMNKIEIWSKSLYEASTSMVDFDYLVKKYLGTPKNNDE